jgi:tRNA nucleotidyltransferase (CCA-adding enzyme)
LRHVSDAFQEDPVRILRTAKFASRFAALGFSVAPDTIELMTQMVADGEADALVPDRVWKETEAALVGPDPRVFFEVLRECGALAVVYPELNDLFGVPQPAKWHPEMDCGLHTMMVVEQAAMLSDALDVRFAALVHDLGKATTPSELLPGHRGHEQRSVDIIRVMAKRLPIPVACRELAVVVADLHGHCHKALELRPATILKVLERTDAFRRPERFEKFLLACEADARGRTGFEDRAYPQADYLSGALAAANTVSTRKLIAEGAEGPAIAKALRTNRADAIAEYAQSVA